MLSNNPHQTNPDWVQIISIHTDQDVTRYLTMTRHALTFNEYTTDELRNLGYISYHYNEALYTRVATPAITDGFFTRDEFPLTQTNVQANDRCNLLFYNMPPTNDPMIYGGTVIRVERSGVGSLMWQIRHKTVRVLVRSDDGTNKLFFWPRFIMLSRASEIAIDNGIPRYGAPVDSREPEPVRQEVLSQAIASEQLCVICSNDFSPDGIQETAVGQDDPNLRDPNLFYAVKLRCDHFFHAQCIRRWQIPAQSEMGEYVEGVSFLQGGYTMSNTSCPSCRFIVEKEFTDGIWRLHSKLRF